MKYTIAFCLLLAFLSCRRIPKADLAIVGVEYLDSQSGELVKGKTLLITDGKISQIQPEKAQFTADSIIEAKKAFLSPCYALLLFDENTDSLNQWGASTYASFSLQKQNTNKATFAQIVPYSHLLRENGTDKKIGALQFLYLDSLAPSTLSNLEKEFNGMPKTLLSLKACKQQKELLLQYLQKDSLPCENLEKIADLIPLNTKETKALQDRFIEFSADSNNLVFMDLEHIRFLIEQKPLAIDSLLRTFTGKKTSLSVHPYWLVGPTYVNKETAQAKRMKQNLQLFILLLKRLQSEGASLRFSIQHASEARYLDPALSALCEAGFSLAEQQAIAYQNSLKLLNAKDIIGAIAVGEMANFLIWKKSPAKDCSYYTEGKTLFAW